MKFGTPPGTRQPPSSSSPPPPPTSTSLSLCAPTLSRFPPPPPPPTPAKSVIEDGPVQKRTLPGVTIIQQQTKDGMSTAQDDAVTATTTIYNSDGEVSLKMELPSGSGNGATSCFADITADEYSMTLLSGYFGLGASKFPPAYECIRAAERKSSSI
mmetsp:Transcript_29265/g.40800  ORF Transcript_29265/g.40800 Transcript_29265/m.40800 type:complete len:156 (+) Transcript_29265:564-1031(+)